MSTRAVYLDITEGYDTRSFLLVLKRFVVLHGYPRTLRSDSGSQLVASTKEVRLMMENWDWKTIYTFGDLEGMQWIMNRSADAPWENGCSESLIKSVKRCMRGAIGTSILTFSELQTAVFEIANLLNERPIGTKTVDPDQGSYLCPNDLLLGRTTLVAPVGQWINVENHRLRLEFLAAVTNAFWKKWIRDYFPTLIVRRKWHTATRNLCEGDVVLVQDSNAIRGTWRLAQVSEAHKGRDGKVRTVTLCYKHQSPNKGYTGVQDSKINRSVHRLVLLLPIEEQFH